MATPAVISSTLILLFLVAFTAGADPSVFHVKNKCSYTVWVAGYPMLYGHVSLGGAELTPGLMWEFTVDNSTTNFSIWARTGCTFDPKTDLGSCDTGDCNNRLYCKGGGKPPITVAEFVMGSNGAPDKFGITVEYGFNVPMDFGCSAADVIRCRDQNCPDAIRGYGYDKYHGCQGNGTSPLLYDVIFCP